MGELLDPSNTNFLQNRMEPYFVDKTSLLAYTNSVLFSSNRFLCVSRPRRFGKTFTVEMLSAYYSCGCDSSTLFQDLNIASSPDCDSHRNQYHVIQLDIQGLSTKLESAQDAQARGQSPGPAQTDYSRLNVVDFLQLSVIQELKAAFPDCSSWSAGLSQCLLDVYNRSPEHPVFVILIDEWDYLFRRKTSAELQKKYISLLVDLFKDIRMKKCIALAWMTGIYPIKKYGIQSELNNFREFTMVSPTVLGEYTGFTESEVRSLCQKANLPFRDFKRWYDGYSFPGVGSIYNPRSVEIALNDRMCKGNWTKTESYEVLKRYINMNFRGLREAIAMLLSGQRKLPFNPERFSNDLGEPETRDEVLTLLVHLGYLACDYRPGRTSFVSIPNQEIREEFKSSTTDDDWSSVIRSLEQSEQLLQATWKEEQSVIAETVDRIHMNYTSSLDYNNENSLSCVLLLAYYTAARLYDITKEENTGLGRADLFFRPKRNSSAIPMVVELKWKDSAVSALQQVRDRRYFQKLSGYPEVLLVGINYDPDSKTHTCLTERWKTR